MKAALLFVAAWLMTSAAWAQPADRETRREVVQAARKAKAARAPRAAEETGNGGIRKLLDAIENRRFLSRIFGPSSGPYVKIGGFGQGGGFGGGPAWRFSSTHVDVDAAGGISLKEYRRAEAALQLRRSRGDWLTADVYTRWRDYPEEDFFGLGPDSRAASQTTFRLRDTLAEAGPTLQLGLVTADARVGYLDPRVAAGEDASLPLATEIFSPASLPGLGPQPDFWRYRASLELSYLNPAPDRSRTELIYLSPEREPHSGGRYTFQFERFEDRGAEQFGFQRTTLELLQIVPVLHDQRTLVARVLYSGATPEAGQQVPFYLQHTLGGAYTLRGFDYQRFRDRHLALFQVEYRWVVNAFLTAALFYDAGQVAPRADALALERFRDDYGFGLRFGWEQAVVLRTDFVFGGEGRRLLVRLDRAF